MPTTLLHLTDRLIMGGCCRDMENAAQQATRTTFRPVLAGVVGDPEFVAALRAKGITAGIVGQDLSGLAALLEGAQSFLTVVHRSGGAAQLWNDILPRLQEAGSDVLIERNIFGFADEGPGGALFDRIYCNSMHTLWRNWTARGRPDIEDYLQRHGVLYNPVLFSADEQQLQDTRGKTRHALGIPADAVVIGDACRPDPRKLDIMIVPVMARLVRARPHVYFVTRTYPEGAARRLALALGEKYRNLAPTNLAADMVETFAIMDIFAHMSTMGESFGMANAEAMRCGLPLVVNETPGPCQNNAQIEMVIHGRTGYLANEPSDVLRRLTELVDSATLRHGMGKAGRARFEVPPFSPRSSNQQLESLLILTARSKSWDPIPGFELAPPIPSKAEVVSYLRNYRPRYTVPPKRENWRDRLWDIQADFLRQWWRLERRITTSRFFQNA